MTTQVKLKNSRHTRYQNALHTSLHDDHCAIVESQSADDLKLWRIDDLVRQWRESITVEGDINREATASQDTQKLEKLDQQRDRIISYLFGIIRTERLYGLTDRRVEAGHNLGIITKTYNGLQNEAYREQTQHVEGLVGDLQKGDMPADLRALGITTAVNDLKKVNAEFKELMRGRADTRSATKLPPAKEQRKITDDLYARILELINGAYLFAATDAERERINAMVTRMNQQTDEHLARYNQATGQTGSGNTTPGIQPGGGGGGNSPEDEPKADGE